MAPLLRKMDDIQKLKLHKHGTWGSTVCVCLWFVFSLLVLSTAENIKMSLLKCDGGQKDDKHKPESILNPPVSGVPSSSSEYWSLSLNISLHCIMSIALVLVSFNVIPKSLYIVLT